MATIEEPLSGGNATAEVVRVDSTVRKPWHTSTPSVHRFMAHLREQGLHHVPEPLGRDAQARQVTEFISGLSVPLDRPLSDTVLRDVGRIIRQIHDASASFTFVEEDSWNTVIPVEHADLVCHNDLAPWNLIDGRSMVFIDWDGAGPSTRLWDLAYAAQSFAFLMDGQEPKAAAARLRAVVIDGYHADHQLLVGLPAAMVARTQSMYDLLADSYREGIQPWGRMFVEGHGAHWAKAARFVKDHETLWAQCLNT